MSEPNIYLQVLSGIKDFPPEKVARFWKEFWGDLSREEKVVFTLDALDAFETEGILDEFLDGVNEGIGRKQDAVLDRFLKEEISKPEMLKLMKETRKIEKSDK